MFILLDIYIYIHLRSHYVYIVTTHLLRCMISDVLYIQVNVFHVLIRFD